MKRFVALIVAMLALAGCVSTPQVTEGVTLSVSSYDPGTGNYELELRNHSTRPVLYLNPYLIFHNVPAPTPEPFPVGPDGTTFMAHDTRLPPGKSVTLTGQCTSKGACSRQGTYAAVLACWFNEAFTCKEYLPVWSEMPLNGA